MQSVETMPEAGARPIAPAPPELVARANALVKQFPGSFWFRHPEALAHDREDVRVVIEHLREYGDKRSWRAAQDLHKAEAASR